MNRPEAVLDRRRPIRPLIDREQAEALHGRSTACPRRSACRSCSATSRASRSTRPPSGSDARPGPCTADWPGPGEAPPRPDPPRRGALDDRAGRRPGAPIRLGVRLIPSCAISTTRAAIQFAARHAAAGGALSAPAAALAQEVLRYHADPQAQAHRDVLAAPRRRRHRRRLARPLAGDDGGSREATRRAAASARLATEPRPAPNPIPPPRPG